MIGRTWGQPQGIAIPPGGAPVFWMSSSLILRVPWPPGALGELSCICSQNRSVVIKATRPLRPDSCHLPAARPDSHLPFSYKDSCSTQLLGQGPCGDRDPELQQQLIAWVEEGPTWGMSASEADRGSLVKVIRRRRTSVSSLCKATLEMTRQRARAWHSLECSGGIWAASGHILLCSLLLAGINWRLWECG